MPRLAVLRYRVLRHDRFDLVAAVSTSRPVTGQTSFVFWLKVAHAVANAQVRGDCPQPDGQYLFIV